MTKIKQARDDVQSYFDGVNCDPVAIIFKIHGQTILKALDALERIDGVDLEKVETGLAAIKEALVMPNDEIPYGFIEILCAAQIVADIKKEQPK